MKTNTAEKQELTAQNFNLRIDKIDVNRNYYLILETLNKKSYIISMDGYHLKISARHLEEVHRKTLDAINFKLSDYFSLCFDMAYFMMESRFSKKTFKRTQKHLDKKTLSLVKRANRGDTKAREVIAEFVGHYIVMELFDEENYTTNSNNNIDVHYDMAVLRQKKHSYTSNSASTSDQSDEYRKMLEQSN